MSNDCSKFSIGILAGFEVRSFRNAVARSCSEYILTPETHHMEAKEIVEVKLIFIIIASKVHCAPARLVSSSYLYRGIVSPRLPDMKLSKQTEKNCTKANLHAEPQQPDIFTKQKSWNRLG